jgi:hypothetical protein
MKAMLRSEKESFRLFFAISSGKTGVIPVCNRNVVVKNWNIAVGNGYAEVGDRNEGVKEEKFDASLIKKSNVTFRPDVDLKELFVRYKKNRARTVKTGQDLQSRKNRNEYKKFL